MKRASTMWTTVARAPLAEREGRAMALAHRRGLLEFAAASTAVCICTLFKVQHPEPAMLNGRISAPAESILSIRWLLVPPLRNTSRLRCGNAGQGNRRSGGLARCAGAQVVSAVAIRNGCPSAERSGERPRVAPTPLDTFLSRRRPQSFPLFCSRASDRLLRTYRPLIQASMPPSAFTGFEGS